MNKLAAVLGVFLFAGCSQIEGWRNPELAACESFFKASLKAPSSYRRIDYTVMDERVSKSLLSRAVGLSGNDALDKAVADGFKNPTIRSVLIHYDAENSFGTALRSAGSCRFAMSDERYVIDKPADAADRAARDNEMRSLTASSRGEEVESGDCCLNKRFDLASWTHSSRPDDVHLVAESKD